MALMAALLSILVYVGFRFEWRLAAGVVIALAHDVIITLGILSLFHIEIDLTIVASLMSVIGYSLNDSIVVSDRIRENFRKIRRGTPYEIFNVSLTQTLHRTLITSGTTLMVILMLYLFGGPVLEGFSLTMLIGVSIGTASSIYVASALALKLGMKREHMLQQKVEKRRGGSAVNSAVIKFPLMLKIPVRRSGFFFDVWRLRKSPHLGKLRVTLHFIQVTLHGYHPKKTMRG